MTGAPTCEAVRESLSALMDREWPSLRREQATEHLGACPECRSWQDRARDATRRVRLGFPAPPDGLAETIIGRVTSHPRSRWAVPLRIALAVVGLAIAVASLPALVYGVDPEAETHAAHELGSLNVALALALVLAAVRPRRAAGILPVFGGAVFLLVLTAGDDIVRGTTTWSHEAPHALVVAGFLLLLGLARTERDRTPVVPAPRSTTAGPAPGATPAGNRWGGQVRAG